MHFYKYIDSAFKNNFSLDFFSKFYAQFSSKNCLKSEYPF